MAQAPNQGHQLRLLQLKLSNRDAQLLSERHQREELEAQLQKASENNRALARNNTRLMQLADNFKNESEVATHEFNTRMAGFRACGAESARQIAQLQLQIEHLTAQLEETQAALIVLQPVQLQPCVRQEQGGGTCNCSGAGGCTVGQGVQQDSFLVCANLAGSARMAGQHQQPSACGEPLCSETCGASGREKLCPQENSFLLCADSANSTTHCPWSSKRAAELADSVDASKEQQQCKDSFTVRVDTRSLGSPCPGGGSEDCSEDCFEQQEQHPPPHALRLPKTVRLLAYRAVIACPLPLQPAGRQPQPARQALQGAAESPGAGESQGSNDPDVAEGMPNGSPSLEAGLRRNPDCAADSEDRESGIRAPCTHHYGSGVLAESEVQPSAAGSSELSSSMHGSETGLRSSSRARTRVSYALPNLRSKLRQGDEFTFGDPAAVPAKPRARTKPKPRFRLPAPGVGVAIPAALKEESELAS